VTVAIAENTSTVLSDTSSEGQVREKLLSPQQPGIPPVEQPGIPSVDYVLAEFPTEPWRVLYAETSNTHTLEQYFMSLLPQDPHIEHIYSNWNEDVLRIWIVIPEPDFKVEAPIYEAQMNFIQKIRDCACDFRVIYRFGRSLESIRPQHTTLVK
jgi:hypothetical protein